LAKVELIGDKVLKPVSGRLSDSGATFEGYEMHVGRTSGPALARPFLTFPSGVSDGAVSSDHRIAGGYVHGLFNLPEPRAALLAAFGGQSNALDRNIVIETALQEIAHELERSLAIKALAQIAGVATD
jgi:adenosylcobyric acid synthase